MADAPLNFNISDTILYNNTANVNITVNYISNPPVTEFVWMLNGETLNGNNRINLTSDTITFNPVIAENDTGNYTLIVTNSQGKENTTFDINVYCKFITSFAYL